MTGREREFEESALAHTPNLLRFARRLTNNAAAAEDLVQETLLRAWRGFDQFRGGTNARAWLFRILLNTFYGQGRKARLTLVSLEETDAAGSNGSVVAAEVAEALSKLPEDHRTILMLGVVEGFSCREMAEMLQIPIGTVMSRMSRARQGMRAQLDLACGEKAYSAKEG